MPVTAITYVAGERPLLFAGTDVCLGTSAAWRPAADVVSQLLGRQKRLLALLTFTFSTSQAPLAYGPVFSEFCANMCQELFFSSETFATVLARVLFVCKVGAHVILHGEPVRVRVVTNRTIIFTGFMRVSVVDQTSCVAIRTPALVTGKWPLVSGLLLRLYLLLLDLGQPSAGSGMG